MRDDEFQSTVRRQLLRYYELPNSSTFSLVVLIVNMDHHNEMDTETEVDTVDRNKCADACTILEDLPTQLPDRGWWILKRIKQNQLFAEFDNADEAKRIFQQIMEIVDNYYVNAEQHLCKLCREENVCIFEVSITDNKRIADFWVKYAKAIKQNEFIICGDIKEEKFLELLSCLSELLAKMVTKKFKSSASSIHNSLVVPLFLPFNHNVDSLFSKFDCFQVSPNPKFTEKNCSEPFFNVKGHVALICEIGESRGNGEKFEVFDLIEPSFSILHNHFNTYIRKKFPNNFKNMYPYLYTKVSKTRMTSSISCMDVHQGKQIVLVLADLSNIYMINWRDQIVPQLKIWINVILSV